MSMHIPITAKALWDRICVSYCRANMHSALPTLPDDFTPLREESFCWWVVCKMSCAVSMHHGACDAAHYGWSYSAALWSGNMLLDVGRNDVYLEVTITWREPILMASRVLLRVGVVGCCWHVCLLDMVICDLSQILFCMLAVFIQNICVDNERCLPPFCPRTCACSLWTQCSWT